ncbi:MAG: RimK family alpha-L-glutamate ligase [Alphaproteobacteria bacterium]
MAGIYVLHENSVWVEPLRAALGEMGLAHEEWFLDAGSLDLTDTPPEGVFYNRMSASSHSRGHRFAPEYTATVLAWLESHGRRVVNDTRALRLEISKVAQYAALSRSGVRTPRTVAVAAGEGGITLAERAAAAAAAAFPGEPVIVKPNRGGKGLGVQLLDGPEAVRNHVAAGGGESLDGVTLLQEYVPSPDRTIVRCEFVGGEFLYAVRVDASGGFELCPADACAIDSGTSTRPQFEILPGFDHPNLGRYRSFLKANGIGIAGVEMTLGARDESWTYDVNTNTNYNAEAEAAVGYTGTDKAGMRAIARFLGAEAGALTPRRAAAAA